MLWVPLISDSLDQTEAISLARQALKAQFGLTDGALDQMTVSSVFSTQIFDSWGKEDAIAVGIRLWETAFFENGALVGASYRVAFSPTGNSLAACRATDTLDAYIRALQDEKGPFRQWSVEDKAAFTESWPYLSTVYQQGLLTGLYAEMLFHRFGLPEEGAVSVRDACQRAAEAVQGLYPTEETLDVVPYGYVIDNPDAPYWSIGLYYNGFRRFSVKVSREGWAEEIAQDGLASVSGITPRATVTPSPAPTPAANELSEADAVAVAQQALVAVYDLPFADVTRYVVVEPQYITDFSRNWYGLTPGEPYWWIGFRRPETEERFYTDYSVLVDAATGTVLQVRDPGNISNG